LHGCLRPLGITSAQAGGPARGPRLP
jgi:hypothetical protein